MLACLLVPSYEVARRFSLLGQCLPSRWLPVLDWLVVACAGLAVGCFSYEVARRLINVEELEYTLETDEEPYEAACSRLVV